MVSKIGTSMLIYKQIPFVHYGNEIGMEHNFAVSKDGGGIRTGARTPMQWTEEKGRGISDKKTTYLSASEKKGQSVEAQEKDENSILNTVKDLIRIRKKYPALYANSSQTFLETGYPAIFERSDGTQRLRFW